MDFKDLVTITKDKKEQFENIGSTCANLVDEYRENVREHYDYYDAKSRLSSVESKIKQLAKFIANNEIMFILNSYDTIKDIEIDDLYENYDYHNDNRLLFDYDISGSKYYNDDCDVYILDKHDVVEVVIERDEDCYPEYQSKNVEFYEFTYKEIDDIYDMIDLEDSE